MGGIFSLCSGGKQWWQLHFLFALLLAFSCVFGFQQGRLSNQLVQKQWFGLFCSTKGGFIASGATVERGWEASSLEWGWEDVVQCQLVPEPAGHHALHFLRHTLDFYHPAGKTISPRQNCRGKWQQRDFPVVIYYLFHLFLWIYTISFMEILFDSHCSNLRMTQTHHPCSICVSFNGRVWLFRVGKAQRNARKINTQKTKQKWKEKNRELKSISQYGL